MLECVVQHKKLGVEGKFSSYGNYIASQKWVECENLGFGGEIVLTLTQKAPTMEPRDWARM